MNPDKMFRAGVVLLATGIAAGAFGAHGLKDQVSADKLVTFEIGVRYQMYGALGLTAAAAWLKHMGLSVSCAATTIVAGVLIFSGTLYGIVLGGPKWLGAITPIGGTLQIVGWAMVAAKSHRKRESNG
ncbi:DUF423 domain-containing protein [bacterium]|nr:DUF423 domain-containing protein [bacterium]